MRYRHITDSATGQPKHEIITEWIEVEYKPQAQAQWGEHTIVWAQDACAFQVALETVGQEMTFEGFRFLGWEALPCPVVDRVSTYLSNRKCGFQSGATRFRFSDGSGQFDVLLVSSYGQHQHSYTTVIACVPQTHIGVWLAFEQECVRIMDCMSPDGDVIVIGGRKSGFDPQVSWDEIVLPEELKSDIMRDVEGFFTKGVEVYKRINLKPFRKLLLAGVPGTGKTMICSAMARWALARGYLVIYASGADRYGSAFDKIHEALDIAAKSRFPALVLVEELDSYLNEDEKAQVLNALDGSEVPLNEFGTLLLATTNYPEAIDERVLKRPGRLDRIFVIPEMRDVGDAGRALRQYIGGYWREEHQHVVPLLVGKPGAFIREVAIHALTQAAYENLDLLPLELLERSTHSLIAQIEAKDDFIKQRRDFGLLNRMRTQ